MNMLTEVIQIQRNLYQTTNDIFLFLQNWNKNIPNCMETQKIPNSQSDLEKEKWTWRNQPSWLQTMPQSYGHQHSVVLAEKQKHRPME